MRIKSQTVHGNGATPAVKTQLSANPQAYHTELLAALGVYQFKQATDDATRRQALSLMRLAEPYYKHEMLSQTMAEARRALAPVLHHNKP